MEKIEKIYRKWGVRKRNTVMVLTGMGGAALYLILRSLFSGMPKFLSLVLCLLAAQAAAAFFMNSAFLKDITRFEVLLTRDCDSRAFLSEVEKGLSYGEKTDLKGLQKSVYRGFQQLYLSALDAEERYEEAEKYLENKMDFAKDSRPYVAHKEACLWDKETAFYLSCEDRRPDEKHLKALYESVRKTSKTKAELPGVEALYRYLCGDAEGAEKILLSYTPGSRYGNVRKQMLLARIYGDAGDKEREIECLEFVAEAGGTLPEKERAKRKLARMGR